MIAGDGAFAVVLAAWWQLRRSAHLLPHLRKGPSSFFFNPGNGFVSRVMVIITQLVLLTIRPPRERSLQVVLGNGQPVPRAGVPDRTRALGAGPRSESDRKELGWATVPIPVPGGSHPAPQPTAPLTLRSTPRPAPRPAVEAPTRPIPVVGARSPRHATPQIGPPIGRPLGSLHGKDGPASVEAPSQPTHPVAAHRGVR